MSEIEDLKKRVRDFAQSRNWEKFHTPKNLAMAVAGEAGELAAEFQWLTPEESSGLTKDQLKAVELEMADVAIYLLRLADVLGIDVAGAVKEKIELNEGRFPKR
jgi:NTP pyrophosphatase (non-canonical NTP hydrolase)